jgi:hypothetical protein
VEVEVLVAYSSPTPFLAATLFHLLVEDAFVDITTEPLGDGDVNITTDLRQGRGT